MATELNQGLILTRTEEVVRGKAEPREGNLYQPPQSQEKPPEGSQPEDEWKSAKSSHRGRKPHEAYSHLQAFALAGPPA